MDDTKFGARDRRGHWAPHEPAQTAPLFAFPPNPRALLKWVPHYFLPYNLVFFLSAWAWWAWIVPPMETMQTLALGWVLWLWAMNSVAVFLWYFAFELQLYIRRRQGARFKYNPKFPGEMPGAVFWFRSQNIENFLRGFLSGVPIWTAIQVLALWGFANGFGTWVTWADSPIYLALICLIVPVIHEFHFFCIHWLIHRPFLYKWVHSVHHKSINPSPWSSLSMHPVEHLLYFLPALYHLILPSNPVIAIYQLHFAGFGAVPGHIGFDKVEVTDEVALDSHAYIHYLHHKYFEVNYGDGLIPIDKWIGTFHDGTDAAHAKMRERLKKRNQKMSAGA